KIFSIIALTVFMAGNLNAMPLPKKSCEDDAWDLAETIYYLSKGDSILAGAVLDAALNLCD
ncbi:MAG: hypothetical protein ABI295_01860, partial [Xanthomarina sp.]